METLTITHDTPRLLELRAIYRPTWEAWKNSVSPDPNLTTPMLPLWAGLGGVVLLGTALGLPQVVTQNELYQLTLTFVLLALGFVGLLLVAYGWRYWQYQQAWRDERVYEIRIERDTRRIHWRSTQGATILEQVVDLAQANIVYAQLDHNAIYLGAQGKAAESFAYRLDIEAPELRQRVYNEILKLLN